MGCVSRGIKASTEMIKCSEGNHKADREENMVLGRAVIICDQCKTCRLEGDDQTHPLNEYAESWLKQHAQQLWAEKNYQDMMDSDIADVRWERMMQ